MKELTTEDIKRASKLAEEDKKPLSGEVIQAIRNMNKAQHTKPLLQRLNDTERAKLQKVVKKKGK